MEFKIFASTLDEINSGWVWVQNSELPPRSIISIRLVTNGKLIYCEALQIDKNFLTNYNQYPRFEITDPARTIVMNHWYRSRLGKIEPQEKYYIEITQANNIGGKFRSCIEHPQIVVRVATWLGVLGGVLGGISVILGGISIFLTSCPK